MRALVDSLRAALKHPPRKFIPQVYALYYPDWNSAKRAWRLVSDWGEPSMDTVGNWHHATIPERFVASPLWLVQTETLLPPDMIFNKVHQIVECDRPGCVAW
jgi:hypothetical protein